MIILREYMGLVYTVEWWDGALDATVTIFFARNPRQFSSLNWSYGNAMVFAESTIYDMTMP